MPLLPQELPLYKEELEVYFSPGKSMGCEPSAGPAEWVMASTSALSSPLAIGPLSLGSHPHPPILL